MFVQITKKQVDSFTPGRGIPSCQLTVEWNGDSRPSRLIHKVTLKGAKKPSNYFRIVLGADPGTYFTIMHEHGSLFLVIYFSHAARHELTSTSSDTSVENSQGKHKGVLISTKQLFATS